MKTVEELQAELDATTDRARKLEAEAVDKTKQLERFKGINLEEIGALKDEVVILRRENAKGDPVKLDEVLAKERAELEKKFGSKFEEYQTENQTLKQKLQRHEVVTPTMLKAASLFRDTELELVNMLVERDLASDNGSVIVKGTDGKPKPSPKDPRKNMSVDEYLEELSVKYPGIAKSKTLGTGKDAGTQSPASSYTGTLPTLNDLMSMSVSEIKAKGITPEQIKLITG